MPIIVIAPYNVAATPEMYQAYIQRSRASSVAPSVPARKLAESHFNSKQIAAKILSHALNDDAFASEGVEPATTHHRLLTTDC